MHSHCSTLWANVPMLLAMPRGGKERLRQRQSEGRDEALIRNVHMQLCECVCLAWQYHWYQSLFVRVCVCVCKCNTMANPVQLPGKHIHIYTHIHPPDSCCNAIFSLSLFLSSACFFFLPCYEYAASASCLLTTTTALRKSNHPVGKKQQQQARSALA